MDVLRKVIHGAALSYTRLGLGLAALGRPGYINLGHAHDLLDRSKDAMRQHAVTLLDAAWEAGVRYFDAARSYGAAEEFLATWLRIRQIDPNAVTLGSKWGYTYTANWQVQAEKHEVKDHSLATLRRQMGESSAHLGPWLRLYQIHSATLESGVLNRGDVLDELARLRDAGLVIGLSLSGPGQTATLEKTLPIRRGEQPLFGSVQATWNLHERSAGSMLEAAHAAGWLVIIKEALANGRLTSRGLPPDAPLRQLSDRLHQPVDAVALAAILTQPWVDVVLSGATTLDQLRSNLRALELRWEPAMEHELSGMAESPERYWSHRAKMPWN
jgi:aryl-alcohol dehydrogenase-like predicted oxidoreductase